MLIIHYYFNLVNSLNYLFLFVIKKFLCHIKIRKGEKMKGIILAGGLGTRLYPASLPISKILLSVYDKPMIYYPLSTLMMSGIKDILIITNPLDYENFKKLLGDGSMYGINFEYKIQYSAKGIADAFIIGEDFIQNDDVALILGDNVFYGKDFDNKLKSAVKNNQGATVFAYKVENPSQFGVVEFDKNGLAVSLEEKPIEPKSNYAVTGLYFYDNNVVEYAKGLTPSQRGELEITDLNKIYLEKNELNVEKLNEDFIWLDTGTHDSVLNAGNFIQKIEKKSGQKVACLEEIALKNGWINPEIVLKNIQDYKNNNYYNYIRDVISNMEQKI